MQDNDTLGLGPSEQDEVQQDFEAAASCLVSAIAAQDKRFTDKLKLQLYGLYKQALTGKCNTSKPGFWDPTGRAKWDAWNALGNLDKAAAQEHYVQLMCDIVPDWNQGGSQQSGQAGSSRGGGMGGPVFSSMAGAQDKDDGQAGPSTVHELASKDDEEGVQVLLAAGTPVDIRDDEGCTALHFAADRGHVAIAQALIRAGADVNAQDNDGQSPLHYAALCAQEEVCKVLLHAGADQSTTDASGQLPKDVGPSSWTCWT